MAINKGAAVSQTTWGLCCGQGGSLCPTAQGLPLNLGSQFCSGGQQRVKVTPGWSGHSGILETQVEMSTGSRRDVPGPAAWLWMGVGCSQQSQPGFLFSLSTSNATLPASSSLAEPPEEEEEDKWIKWAGLEPRGHGRGHKPALLAGLTDTPQCGRPASPACSTPQPQKLHERKSWRGFISLPCQNLSLQPHLAGMLVLLPLL